MCTLPYVVAALIALGGGVQLHQLEAQIQASQQLKKGDSEARVLQVLGEPHERWPKRAGFFSGPAEWIYGTDVDVRKIVDSESVMPNLVPIKLRIFSPDEGDLVVTWDDKGAIASVVRPKTDD